jgi:RNA polymerase sigma factor (sigma-70 family)
LDSPDTEHAAWFAREVQSHEPALRSYLRKLVTSHSDVDDIVQESYMRLFRTKQNGKISYPKAYLFATARNAALDMFRHSQVVSIEGVGDIESLSVIEEGPGVAETVILFQELQCLADAIESLPKRCRQVLKLRKIYGFSHKEIARRLRISEHTVNAQLAKGVARCVRFLRARGITGASHDGKGSAAPSG